MKRSIQIQIALVVIAIFVLIGVLFYNPADVEKKTQILVDFGDGSPRAVGETVVPTKGGKSPKKEAGPPAEPADETGASALEVSKPADAEAETKPVENVPGQPAAPIVSPTPNPSSAKIKLLPKGTPPPMTPSPTKKPMTPSPYSNPAVFPGGMPTPNKLETEHK